MTTVATKRLIDASAKLGPDDRALLSLLINHGLDDGALARLTRARRAEVAARRELLAERLGTVLELSPAIVQHALDELAGTARGHQAAAAPSATGSNHTYPESPQGDVPPAGSEAALPAPGRREAGSSRDRRLAAFALLAITVAVLAALVIALSGGDRGSRGAVKAGEKAGSKAAGGKTALSHVSARSRGALVGLPGGPAGVRGTFAITGPAARPQLMVAASALPAAGPGHYELWLYNSIIDSTALAALGASGRSVAVALPSGYRRYRWLDVSLQPPGAVNHSGESVLRAALPG